MNFTADQKSQINEFDWEEILNNERSSLAHTPPLPTLQIFAAMSYGSV